MRIREKTIPVDKDRYYNMFNMPKPAPVPLTGGENFGKLNVNEPHGYNLRHIKSYNEAWLKKYPKHYDNNQEKSYFCFIEANGNRHVAMHYPATDVMRKVEVGFVELDSYWAKSEYTFVRYAKGKEI